MKKINTILGAVLALQLVLVVLFNVDWRQPQADGATQLLALETAEAVDRLTIEEEDRQLVVKKVEGRWLLPATDNLPANVDKVKEALDDLLALKKGWAIAKTEAAAERFAVGEKDYKKRIQLYGGERPLATLYLGTSPGYRKVHARLEGEPEVYAVELDSHELTGKAFDWLDQSLLQLPEADMRQLRHGDITLVKHKQEGKDEQWRLQDQRDDETLAQGKVEELIDAVTALRISDLLAGDKVAEYQSEEPVASITATLDSGSVDYAFYLKGEEAVVKSSRYDRWFKVAKYQVDKLKELNRVAVIAPPKPTADAVITETEAKQDAVGS